MASAQKPGRPNHSELGNGVDRKQAIADAAAQSFNSRGFDKTTIRAIAETAGVDPKLVVHYFGTKADLFASTFSMPEQADVVREVLKTVPKPDWGAVIASVLINDENQLVSSAGAGLIRAATTHPAGSTLFRDVFSKITLGPFLASLGVDNATLRAATLESLIVGLSFSDFVLEIPTGLENDYQRRKALLGAVIHSILTSDIADH